MRNGEKGIFVARVRFPLFHNFSLFPDLFLLFTYLFPIISAERLSHSAHTTQVQADCDQPFYYRQGDARPSCRLTRSIKGEPPALLLHRLRGFSLRISFSSDFPTCHSSSCSEISLRRVFDDHTRPSPNRPRRSLRLLLSIYEK